MRLPLYQVDAFADRVFAGNPAAVVPLPDWIPAERMQAIALENNLSETAFIVGRGGDYAIRWFTPTTEVPLCGHATLASAFVVSTILEPGRAFITFRCDAHGELPVLRLKDVYQLDFPSQPPRRAKAPRGLASALGTKPEEVFAASQLLVVLRDTWEVQELEPDLEWIRQLSHHGLVVTARGADCDFVSRYFVPQSGVPEDPVTGSTHCVLTPFWAARLGRIRLRARQVSKRGGILECELRGDRVLIGGRAVLYLEGTIAI